MEIRGTWARTIPPGAERLRRGVWYQIVSGEMGPIVVVDAVTRTMAVPLHRLELREERPQVFSVVQRGPTDRNPVRGTPQDLGLVYAVCPECGQRIRVAHTIEELDCPQCGHHARVGWDALC